MPSSSKLDYLASKYATTSTKESSKRKKKKKSKKSKRADRDESDNAEWNSHQDDDFPAEEEDDDDQPLVVPSEELNMEDNNRITRNQTRGTWETTNLEAAPSSTSAAPRRERHDSDSDEPSERQPRRRYDSSDDENEERDIKRDKHAGVKQENSGPSPHRAGRSNRRRYDSEDEESLPSGRPSRRRHDSDDDDKENASKSVGQVKQEETDQSKHQRSRRRYDSSDSDSDSGRDTRHQRHDSDGSSKNETTMRRHGQNDSKRRRYDSDDSANSEDRQRMSSGHKAGLTNYRDFNKAEDKIQQQKREDAQRMVDKYGMGETVHRDQDGKRELAGSTADGDKKLPVLDAASEQRLNQGKVQREATLAREREFEILQQSAFARRDDDHRLEAIRKQEIREGDPMAAYAAKRQQSTKKKRRTATDTTVPVETKPLYKGPPPKPNRYGIRPGYRWDGVDRGNDFEDKLLAQQFSSKRKKEDAYRWRSADM